MYQFEIHLLNWDIPSPRQKTLMEWMFGSAQASYNTSDYRHVYSREIDIPEVNPQEVFTELQGKDQNIYPDRSMSLGDVIRVYNGDTVTKTYLVTPFGIDLIQN